MITLLLLVRATYIYGVVLHALPVRGESHNQRNTTGEVATVPAAQQLITSSGNNNRSAAQWADHQWNAEWTDNPTRLCTSIPDTGTHTPRNDPPKKSLGSAQPPPHRCWTFPLLPVQMRYGLLCSLRMWRRTNRRPCRPPLSNPSTPTDYTA